ncbi:hypothetical protein Tco_0059571 [Tanacetum coccineum]
MDIFTKGALWDYWKIGGDEIEVSDNESSDLEEYWSEIRKKPLKFLRLTLMILWGLKAMKITKTIGSDNEQELPMGTMTSMLEMEYEGEPKPFEPYCKPFNYKMDVQMANLVGERIGYFNGGTFPVLTILETRSIPNLDVMMNQAMIVGKDERAMRFTTTIMMKGNMKTKLMKRDMKEYVAVKENEYDDLTFTSEEGEPELTRHISNMGRRMDVTAHARPRERNIDDMVRIQSEILKCCSHKLQGGVQHNLLNKLNMKNLPSKY